MTQSGKAVACTILCSACGMLLLAVTGCSNAGEGALSGGAVGALSGLAIGSLSGDAGAGAAIGAVVGGVGGAVIGDQNRRQDERAAAAAAAPPKPAPPPQYATGTPLGRLVGQWRIKGTIDTEAAAGTVPVEGSATATADKTYFVRIDIHFKDPRSNQTVDGTSIISQTGGRGVEMINVFSSTPQVRRFRGEMDASGTTFTFNQTEPRDQTRKVILRTSTSPGFTAEAYEGDKRVESYSFVPG